MYSSRGIVMHSPKNLMPRVLLGLDPDVKCGPRRVVAQFEIAYHEGHEVTHRQTEPLPQAAPRGSVLNVSSAPKLCVGPFLSPPFRLNFSSSFHREVASSTGSAQRRNAFVLRAETIWMRVFAAKTCEFCPCRMIAVEPAAAGDSRG
jgi:hypothetical protein